MVDRRILSVSLESEDTCIVELDCGHRRHVRDRPPLERFAWVRDAEARQSRIDTRIECGRCDALERPADARRYREGPEWTNESLPTGLRRVHALKAGVWGELVVLAGRVRLRYEPPIARELELGVGDVASIPPEVAHELEMAPDAAVRLDFYRAGP